MAAPDGLRHDVARDVRDAVVRPLSRAAERPCARPGCPSPATATLTFQYGTRQAWVRRLAETATPDAYDLCGNHAGRTHVPRGWELTDTRPPEERDVPTPRAPVDLGGDETVAVLAAALRAVPDVGPPSNAAARLASRRVAARRPRRAPVDTSARSEDVTSPVLGSAFGSALQAPPDRGSDASARTETAPTPTAAAPTAATPTAPEPTAAAPEPPTPTAATPTAPGSAAPAARPARRRAAPTSTPQGPATTW